ncbi:hypothetical protein ACFWCF_01485 [Rhodococcus sp. NPDC060090]|uniref:hypothetical protein n=1 Tax=Rhodococcus sp. NPDC060090 TaxID=3347056 RepID=UPI00366124C0
MQTVSIPSPDSMRSRWAALAAMMASRGPAWGRSCYASGNTWHYDDGGGNWVDLRWVDDQRAVLVGYDHEYSETYFDAAAEYFECDATDILAGAPDWWSETIADYLQRQRDKGEWIGFVYGFENGRWTRVDYSVDDGFRSVGLPCVDHESTREHIVTMLKIVESGDHEADLAIIDAVLAQGAALDPHTAGALLQPRELDTAAAVEAAKLFEHP